MAVEDGDRVNGWIEDLRGLSFHQGEARDANQLIADARQQSHGRRPDEGGFSFEIMVPNAASETWFLEEALPKLVYHCETRRAPLPACQGVFVSFFVGDRLFCVQAKALIAWVAQRFGVSSESLVQQHGTGEARVALRGEGPGGRPQADEGAQGPKDPKTPLLLGS